MIILGFFIGLLAGLLIFYRPDLRCRLEVVENDLAWYAKRNRALEEQNTALQSQLGDSNDANWWKDEA